MAALRGENKTLVMMPKDEAWKALTRSSTNLRVYMVPFDIKRFPDLNDNQTEDPLVLLSWRCTRLSLLAIHGYTVWVHNLIEIAQLCGSGFKLLEVMEDSIDFDQWELTDQDVDPVHNLTEQGSLGLGQPRHTITDIELLGIFAKPFRSFYRETQSFSDLQVWS
ncbi:hypothetical protein NDU88_002522 [Pleurodeles waltl]|uniref:Uncharacterized protein n=1 Tax=Pleurodeles waltl TaxID=8319 RepID=A0AAV7T3J3_PLEWA|nr:hypothetical protein NDU88_002522 [Pleurodeles waltl]